MQFRICEWSRMFWNDETGAVVSAELALIASLGIVGATVGMESLSKSVNAELTDVAFAIRSLDQSYCVAPKCSPGAYMAGSHFQQQDVKTSHAELRQFQQEIEKRQKSEEQPLKQDKKKRKKNKEDDTNESE